MSFSAEAKNEICLQPPKDEYIAAELFAQTFVCGSISINSNGTGIRYSTENMAVAKRIYGSLTNFFALDALVEVKESQLKKKHTYSVVAQGAEKLLKILHAEDLGATLPKEYAKDDENRLALLRGAFLGCGSVSNPKKNYHLEFVLSTSAFAEILKNLLLYFNIKSKIIHRKQNYVVYLNEGDGIASLLTLLGAHSSTLDLENVRVLKEMRNNVNRAVNCDTANINKTVNAALSQLENISIIDQNIGIDKLSGPLQEAAALRINNPEATLQELCEMCSATKSAMNHRFRKLSSIANTFKREESI